MNRQFVKSSEIRSVGYDPSAKVLEIEFNSGGIYQYFGVPEHLYTELMAASSHGTYFNQHIKNKFSYAKIPIDTTAK